MRASLLKRRWALHQNNFGTSDTGLIFGARLQNSLVPYRAAGSATPTFTRATTAFVTDFEGLLKPVLSGEARFTGARRVYNIVPATSENLTNVNWTAAATATKDSATQITFAAASDNVQSASITTGASKVFRIRAKMRGTAGNKVNLYLTDTATGGKGGGFQVTLTASDQVWSGLVTLGAATETYRLYIDSRGGLAGTALSSGTAPQTFSITEIQIEEVTGQSNQNPSEYVSVGVLSAPYHGANVDGVKYFTTLNGNTVASNVVTEATGAAIADATLKGYLEEEARTNLCLQSQTLGTTWIAANISVTADQVVAPDGTTTADLLTAAASTAVHAVYQSSAIASDTYNAISAYIKPGTCGFFVLNIQGAANNYASQVFNLSGAGATGESSVGATSGTILANSAFVTALPGGWFRVGFVAKVTHAGTAYLLVGHAKAATGNTFDTSGQITDAAASLTSYAWGAQLEAASFASTYIPTTTASVTRNADDLEYAVAGNINEVAGTIYAEVSAMSISTGEVAAGGTDSNRQWLRLTSSTGMSVFDGTNNNSKAGLTAIGNNEIRKMAVSFSGSTMSLTGSGAAPTSAAYNGDIAAANANFVIGGYAGTKADGGTVRNFRIYSRALSDAQLQAMTT